MKQHTRHGATILVLGVLSASTVLARTPTPTPTWTKTDGPSPTATITRDPAETSTPTPTGTQAIPSVYIDTSPNPARSGQLVTLNANRFSDSRTYRWEQLGDGVRVEIEDADQPTAHFIAPAVTEITLIAVQVTVSGLISGPASATIMVLPADVIVAHVVGGTGPPGATVPVEVSLQSWGLAVTGLEHELGFTRYAPVVDRGGGVPDCEPAPGLSIISASFAFVPDGCAPTDTCTGVHASLTAGESIPNLAYRCTVELLDAESPPEEGCYHAMTCDGGDATGPLGTPLRVLCPEGSDGFVLAEYALRPLGFEFRAEPAAPNVGDAVRVTFSVHGEGGLPRYTLYGAEPILHGETSALPGGPLGDVSFDLVADCPGTAPLSIGIDYETVFGCPGNSYFRFTNGYSGVFPLTVREPGSFRITGRVARFPSGCEGGAFAQVRLDPLRWLGWADGNGEFAFDGVPPGDYTVVVAEQCNSVQCWPQQAVHVADQDVALTLCPVRLAGDACIGDCDLDGAVRIDELLVGVSMALGGQPFSACPALDADGDGAILVSEVIRAVQSSLTGCP